MASEQSRYRSGSMDNELKYVIAHVGSSGYPGYRCPISPEAYRRHHIPSGKGPTSEPAHASSRQEGTKTSVNN